MWELAARFLLAPEPEIVNVVGPARYSDDDAARTVSELADRRISAAPVPVGEVAAAHEAVGIGSSAAAAIAAMYAAMNGAGIPFADASRAVVGRTTLRDVLVAAVAPAQA